MNNTDAMKENVIEQMSLEQTSFDQLSLRLMLFDILNKCDNNEQP